MALLHVVNAVWFFLYRCSIHEYITLDRDFVVVAKPIVVVLWLLMKKKEEEAEEALRDKVQVLEKQVLRLFERQEELLGYYRELGSSLVEYLKENAEKE